MKEIAMVELSHKKENWGSPLEIITDDSVSSVTSAVCSIIGQNLSI